MKKETGKKNKLWLWVGIAAAAVLIVTGVVLAVVLGGGNGPQSTAVSGELYWNIDRIKYTENAEVEGTSTREPAEDGHYYMRFAYQGEQVELQIIDKQLVNWIDQSDLLGLILDADGVVVDAVEPEEVATPVAIGQYVRSVDGNQIVINSSHAMNGMETTLILTENTGVYDVDRKAEMVGAVAEAEIMDQVHIYSNEAGELTHVYITERAPDAEVYWRLERMYDSEKGMTTRVPDEYGVYTIPSSHNGEHVDVKTKDVSIVNYIDSLALLYGEYAPLFDEEGYIIEVVSVAMSLRGKALCRDYHITQINGDTVTATRISKGADQGNVVTFTMNDTCQIYMTCEGCFDSHIGESVSDLRLNDRINLYTDLDNNPVMLFVTRRMVDSPVYYNVDRKYANNSTTREPDANGYYVFELACDGKAVTVRTKDKEIANEMDARYDRCFGLKLNGDIVERVYLSRCVTGEGTYAINRYITKLSGGPIFEAMAYNDFEKIDNFFMSADCKIYDVTTGFYEVNLGEETTMNLYDSITCLRNIQGEVTHIFVLNRYVGDVPLYFNTKRMYSSKEGGTTREPDAEGYYVYDMICNGKEVTVKTKNKKLASYIDLQNAPIVALKVSNGIVKAAYPAASAIKYGYKTANYQYVDKIYKDGSFKTYYMSNGERKESTYNFKMASNCTVYNVSNAYLNNKGEKTTLKVGDQIQAFGVYPASYPDATIAKIFVLNRKLDSPMYKNVKQMYNWTTKESTREPNADGWYIFNLAADGVVKQFKTNDKAIADAVDSYELGFTMVTDGDIILRACSPTMHKLVSSSAASYHDVMTLDGNKATLFRNQPNSSKYGDSAELTFAEDCIYYDFSPYAESFGQKTTLSLGDRVHCYLNQEGEVSICFILYKNTHKKGHVSYCEHCGQNVFWNPYTGSVGARDAHYYVTHNGEIPYQGNVGAKDLAKDAQYDVVIDLNGYTMVSKNRAFLVYGTLSVYDTVGGGGISSKNSAFGHGSCVMVTGDGVFNLYAGTLSQAANAAETKVGGLVYVSSGNSTFNMYGGALVNGHVTDRGGNLYISNGSGTVTGGTFNMYGGTISGGTADTDGGNILAGAKSTLNICGGTISGDIAVNSNVTVKLSGSPVISLGNVTGLELAREVLIDVGGMKQGASVVVSADGFFTKADANISQYAAYFKTSKAEDKILVKDNALYYEKAKRDLNLLDNSNLTFAAGTTRAECPYCEREVTWTELKGGSETLEPVGGTHYYLASDITYTGNEWLLRAPYSDNVVCVHLNGHNITATNGRVVQGYPGTLNIMGNGIVSGNATVKAAPSQGSTINTNTNNKYGTINLIGGTYVAPESNTQKAVVSISNNGGCINLYDGATIEADNKEYGVFVGNATLADATFGMYGGRINDGIVYVSGANTEAGNNTIFLLSGGTINSGVRAFANSTVAVGGKPVVAGTGMVLSSGAKINLGQMEDGANVLISATGIFTNEYADAASCAAYFTPVDSNAQIVVDGNVLRYSIIGGIDLDANGYAYCDACQENVKWTVVNGQVYKPENGGHYYFKSTDGSGIVSTPYQLITWPDDLNAEYELCLHLNGQRVETGSRMYMSKGTVNIMGDGTLAGTGTTTSPSLLTGTLTVEGGTLNLLGGIYTSEEASAPAINMNYKATTVNVYDGVVIGDMAFARTGNNVSIKGGNFNMYGGTVTGDAVVDANAKVSLSGAPVISKGDVGGLTLADGAKITLNQLTDTASIVVSANGAFTVENENAAQYAAYFHPQKDIDTIQVQNNVLYYTKGVKDYNLVDNSDLVFDADTTKAVCPACDEKVQWTALSGDAALTLQGGGHYYLSSDITYAGAENAFLTAPGSGRTACIHLNGHSITATAHRVIEGNGSTLNIMGNGTVSGSYNTDRLYGATINMAAGESKGEINLIGGVFTKNTACNVSSIVLLRNGGDVNLYAGAEIRGVNDGKSLANVSVFYHSFNMYGGKLSGGTGNQVVTNNWSSTKTGLFTMSGGEIIGNVSVNGAEVKHGGCTISGGTITGTLTLARFTDNTISGGKITDGVKFGSTATSDNSTVTLSGTPVIGGVGMKLNTGYLLTLGELTEGADILMSAVGVFTAENEKAADYAKYFKAIEGYEIAVRGNVLACTAVGILELDANGYGYCDACQQTVKWTKISGQVYKQASGSHCYFESKDGSDVVSTPYQLITWPDSVAADYKLCLHLNGQRVETGSRALMNTGNLNIMGKGSLVGTGTTTSTSLLTGTLTINGGTLSLYGGNYTSEVSGVPAIITKFNSATVNAYDVNVVGGIQITKGTLNLGGPSVADVITVAEGKLNVKENWTGTATASFAALADNTIPAANGTSEGDYTGNLFLSGNDNSVVKGVDGGLKVVASGKQDDGVLKILAIGNSFAVDPTHLLYEVYRAENPGKQIVIGVLNQSGASLSDHVNNLNRNLGSYYYHKLDSGIYAGSGKWKITSKVTLLEALRDEQWDVVTMQQASGSTPDSDSYNSDIGIIRNYVAGGLGYVPKFAWNFTWAYADDDELLNTNTAQFVANFKNNYGTSEAMYNLINQAVQKKIIDGNYSFDYLMPVGTAIQNARINGLTAKELHRDALHLNNLGRLIAAYTWFCELEGYDGTTKALTDIKLTTVPAALALTGEYSNGVAQLDDATKALIIESVNNAMKNKMAVTSVNN